MGYVGKKSFSGYTDRRFKPRLHQYVVSLSKTLYPNCLEMSTKREYPREGYLFNAMSFPEEIAYKI